MAQRLDGIALGLMAAGGFLVYAGIRGKSVPSLITGFIKGQSPANAVGANPINPITSGPLLANITAPGNISGSENVSGGSAQQLLQTAAAQHGWGSGQEWQSLQSVEMAEAGFNAQARNPSSGAYGLGQALGHGNANTAAADGTNQYGGYGLTDAEAQAANSGDAGEQAVWMCNYIAATYGDPNAAWAHEQANGWY